LCKNLDDIHVFCQPDILNLGGGGQFQVQAFQLYFLIFLFNVTNEYIANNTSLFDDSIFGIEIDAHNFIQFENRISGFQIKLAEWLW